MKKITTMILCILIISGIYVCSYYEHNYARKNCIVEQSSSGNVMITDKKGNVWEWSQDKNNVLCVGQVVDLNMHDNNTTDNIEDDVITQVYVKEVTK